jgi:hypothetical protein
MHRWGSAGSLLVACVSLYGCISLCGCAAAPKPEPKKPVVAAPVEPREATIPVRKKGGDKVIVEVGKAGGTLELDNGARLEIPQGALGETVEITFAHGNKTTAFSNHDWERPLGPTLEIAPGIALGAPVKVSVPVTTLPEGFAETDLALGLEVASDEQRAVQMHGVATRWDYFPAAASSGRAVAELNELPGYRLQFVVSKNE